MRGKRLAPRYSSIQATAARRPSSSGTGPRSGNNYRSSVLSAWGRAVKGPDVDVVALLRLMADDVVEPAGHLGHDGRHRHLEATMVAATTRAWHSHVLLPPVNYYQYGLLTDDNGTTQSPNGWAATTTFDSGSLALGNDTLALNCSVQVGASIRCKTRTEGRGRAADR